MTPSTDTRVSAGTPGPWACTTRLGSWDWVVYSADDPNIEICQMFHDGTDLNERGEANARLIAAAPEMFGALCFAHQHLLDDTFRGDAIDEFFGMAKSALTKARAAS
jgi:hypothetical protein